MCFDVMLQNSNEENCRSLCNMASRGMRQDASRSIELTIALEGFSGSSSIVSPDRNVLGLLSLHSG